MQWFETHIKGGNAMCSFWACDTMGRTNLVHLSITLSGPMFSPVHPFGMLSGIHHGKAEAENE
jgi:hypothetical protein